MVHVLGDQGDLDALIDRHDHLWVGGRRTVDLDLLGWIGELPLPLVADHLDLDPNVLWLPVINDVEHPGRGKEEGDHDNERNDRPDDFKDEVAVGLDWERGVTRLPAVADHRPDDQPLNQDEDNGGYGEDQVVEISNLQRLVGHGRWGEGRLTAGRNEGDGGQAQQHREFLHG